MLGHTSDQKTSWQLGENLDLEQAEDLEPMSAACGINDLGYYFDKDPYYYLCDDFLQAVAVVCLNWVATETWDKKCLTNSGQTLIRIVEQTRLAYSQLVAKITKKDK